MAIGGSAKQQIVHLAFVLEGQCSQFPWQGKYDMEVLALQEFGPPLLQPLRPGERLTLGAMAIRARVVSVTFVAALVALLQMAAERRGAAAFDGAQYALLPHGQGLGMRPAKLVAMGAHNVGDFEFGPHEEDGPTIGDQRRGKGVDPMGWWWRRRCW